MKYVLMITILLLVSGCQSDIEKCINAGMKVEKNFKPNMPKAEIEEHEYIKRLTCMRAQGGG